MERAEIARGLRGRILIEKVNSAMSIGLGVDANTYFEAITEAEDGEALNDFDWPNEGALVDHYRSLGSNAVLDENNRPYKAPKKRR